MTYEFIYTCDRSDAQLSFQGTEQEWKDFTNDRGGSFTVIRKISLEMNVFELWNGSELAMDVPIKCVGLMRKIRIDSSVGKVCARLILQAEELARTLKELNDDNSYNALGSLVAEAIVTVIES